MVAAIDVMPSSSGTPAATAAPKVSSRMSSVPPMEICCSLASSARCLAPMAFWYDASPNSSTRTSGCAFWTAATVASGATAAFSRYSLSPSLSVPGSEKSTSTERPSSDVIGFSTLLTPGVDSRRLTTSVDCSGDLRAVGPDRALALHQNALADLRRVAGGVDHHVVLLRLAVAHLGRLERLLADLAADDGREDHEQEPADDCLLAVLRAPSACALRDVAALHWGAPPGSRGWVIGRLPPAPTASHMGQQASTGHE